MAYNHVVRSGLGMRVRACLVWWLHTMFLLLCFVLAVVVASVGHGLLWKRVFKLVSGVGAIVLLSCVHVCLLSTSLLICLLARCLCYSYMLSVQITWGAAAMLYGVWLCSAFVV